MSKRLEVLLKNLEKNPKDSFTRYAIALEYRTANDIEKAINMLEALQKDDPNYVSLYYQLGEIYAKRGEAEKAKVTYKAGILAAIQTTDFHAQAELENFLKELN